MRSIIFYSVAEYCDYTSKLILKCKDKQTRVSIWDSESKKYTHTTKKYATKKKAYTAFKELIGTTILGGWKVLNLYPEQVKWEEEE